jgi:hypothetical protein
VAHGRIALYFDEALVIVGVECAPGGVLDVPDDNGGDPDWIANI